MARAFPATGLILARLGRLACGGEAILFSVFGHVLSDEDAALAEMPGGGTLL